MSTDRTVRTDRTVDLLVVGAGPAGMAAAVAADAQGLDVVVLDEQQQPGGQIFRRPVPALREGPHRWPAGYPWGPDLVEASERSGVEWRWGTTALGVLRDGPGARLRVVTTGPDGPGEVRARRLLVATGAYDMPVALPGWTLPGVTTAGAVQGLLKSQGMLVGRRPVLAGSHPLLLLVADQMLAAGADVSEVVLARGLPGPIEATRALPALPGHLGLLAATAAAVVRLRRAGVRVRTRTVVTRALGTDAVTAVELSRVDAAWRPVGPRRITPADTLVLGYGFHPSTELARQAGCAVRWDSAAGGWVVEHHGDQRTSVPDVLVAGEPAGVRGAEQARAEGELAGLVVAGELRPGSVVASDLSRARRGVRRASRFSAVVQRVFAPDRAGLLGLAEQDTLLCRCEGVTRGTVEHALTDAHVSTTDSVKLACRTGMGMCQGRYCEATVGTLTALRSGRPMGQVGPFSARFPVKPVPLGDLCGLDAAEDERGTAASPQEPPV